MKNLKLFLNNKNVSNLLFNNNKKNMYNSYFL